MKQERNELGKMERKERFIQLRVKGHSYNDIARKLRVSKGTLANWNREFEQEIARLKAMELESLYEQYGMMKECRIRSLGEMLKKLREEALSRELSDVPTHKIFQILLKYDSNLQKEYLEIRPLSDDQIRTLGEAGPTNGELDSQGIAQELHRTLRRYRADVITSEQADREQELLKAMLKAREQEQMEARLDRLEAAILEMKR